MDIGGDVDSIAALDLGSFPAPCDVNSIAGHAPIERSLLEALCLGVVGGSAGLGFGEANGLPQPEAIHNTLSALQRWCVAGS